MTWRLAGSHPTRHEGPRWLRIAEVAACVMKCIKECDCVLFNLHAFVIMPDHVHLLITPGVELAQITRTIKGRSARQANLLLGRTGSPFWQDESFDHWIRNSQEFNEVKTYIEQNPVRARLAGAPEQWPYSSAACAARSANSE